jgi:serine/arginine repetitive matrix protein 1
MTDAGFFKGTSADQDSRFSDKNKKLMKTMKFADNLEKKVKLKRFKYNNFYLFSL